MKTSAIVLFSILLVPQFYVYPFFNSSTEYAIKLGFRALMLGVIIIDIFLFSLRRLPSPSKASIYSLYATALIAVISTIYSPDPITTGIRAADLISFIIMALYFCSIIRTTEELALFIEYVIYIYLGGFFLLAFLSDETIWRAMGQDGIERLGGYIINPNIFAYSLLLLLAAQIHVMRKRNILLILMFFSIEILAFYLCYSRSATLALIVSLIFVLRPSSIGAQSVLLLTKTSMVLFLIFSSGYILRFFERGHGIENLTSLGGRTDVWTVIINQSQFGINILWGFGYQMLSSDGLTSSDGDISITMAHSNFIQTFLGLGIIGFILLVIFWIDALRVAYDYKNRTRETQNFLRISSLLVLFYSIVEYGVFGPPTIISPLFLTILIHSSQSYLNISTILHRSKNVSVF